jgi:hypothetical protein
MSRKRGPPSFLQEYDRGIDVDDDDDADADADADEEEKVREVPKALSSSARRKKASRNNQSEDEKAACVELNSAARKTSR